jgi:hypothetical protein
MYLVNVPKLYPKSLIIAKRGGLLVGANYYVTKIVIYFDNSNLLRNYF